MAPDKPELFAFYNLRVGRNFLQVRREVRALLAEKPLVLGLCEAVGYHLPNVPGYVLVRDRSNKSRANIAAYVREGAFRRRRWHDLKQTWSRTEHPGTHEARSWLELNVDGLQVLVGHQPPKGTDNTPAAQQEGIDFLVERMAPWTRHTWLNRVPVLRVRAKRRPRVVMMDANRQRGEDGPGPARLAARLKGCTVGVFIDLAVVRGSASGIDAHYVKQVNGVRLETDHPWGAFLFRLVP